MHKRFRRFLICAAWVCNGLSGLSPASAQVGIVRTVEGQVSVLSGKQECAPRYGLDLEEGDAIRTSAKAWALLSMMDGTKITVRPDTEVRITIYRYTDSGEAWQNRALLALARGAVRVTAGRIASSRGSEFVVRTPDASMEMRGADSDITHIASKPSTADAAAVGTYGRAYSGEAVLKNASGEATIRDGQTAYAELRTPPRVLSTNPYFYYWHGYIDRRAATVADKLESGFLP
jgi:hypothetical protein